MGGTPCSTCLMGYLPGQAGCRPAPKTHTLLRNLGDMLARVDRALARLFPSGTRTAFGLGRAAASGTHRIHPHTSAQTTLRRLTSRSSASLREVA